MMNLFRLWTIIFLFLMLFAGISNAAEKSTAKTKPKTAPEKYATLVVNAATGEVIHQENAGKIRYPASLTKVMTLYLAFEALKNKEFDFTDKLYVSKYASSRPRTNLNLTEGEKITMKDAVMALIVKSANDAAVVIAESVSGTEELFAQKMNAKAKILGLKNTHFRNASGWYDPKQHTTAYDMARLAIKIKKDFPEYYHLFAETSFNFKGQQIVGHNRVTKDYEWADGLKTGYTIPSGFNLVTTAQKEQNKLVGVVLGGQTAASRDKKMIDLLERSFAKLEGKEVQTQIDEVIEKSIAEVKPKPVIQQVQKEQKLAKTPEKKVVKSSVSKTKLTSSSKNKKQVAQKSKKKVQVAHHTPSKAKKKS